MSRTDKRFISVLYLVTKRKIRGNVTQLGKEALARLSVTKISCGGIGKHYLAQSNNQADMVQIHNRVKKKHG